MLNHALYAAPPSKENDEKKGKDFWVTINTPAHYSDCAIMQLDYLAMGRCRRENSGENRASNRELLQFLRIDKFNIRPNLGPTPVMG
jgi:hypothetical protein